LTVNFYDCVHFINTKRFLRKANDHLPLLIRASTD
jgi:hypothetical protein